MTENEDLILLVDDNENDTLLFCRVFKQAGFTNRVVTISSGAEAMEYLSGEGRYSNRTEFPLPRLILMDIKMPGISGLDLLAWVRGREELKNVPVIMLTTSYFGSDITAAYASGANSFMVKPTQLDEFKEQIKAMGNFWLQHSRLPPVGGSAPPPA